MIPKPTLTALLLLVGFLLVPFPARAQEEEDAQQAVEALLKSVEWVRGPGRGVMESLAEVDVPEGYGFTAGKGTRRILEEYGNLPGPQNKGFLAPLSFVEEGDPAAWWLVFSFDDIGYVKGADEEEIDADELLDELRESSKQENETRRQQGKAIMTLVGWARPPYYDPETRDLQWGIRYRTEDGSIVINHNIRLLGRRGVMEAVLVVDPVDYDPALAEAKNVLTGYRFQAGQTYGEYRAGDKVWEYGLTGLIVGTGAAVALKSGLFKWLWKIIVAVGVGIAALFRKIFGGGSKRNVYRRRQGGEAPPAA